jgi:hypothetical protein
MQDLAKLPFVGKSIGVTRRTRRNEEENAGAGAASSRAGASPEGCRIVARDATPGIAAHKQRPTHQLSEVMRDVKRKSSEWIHETIGARGFAWQDGYGVFSVSYSQVDAVRSYVQRQEEHHRTRSFREEYLEFLHRHMVEFDERFV